MRSQQKPVHDSHTDEIKKDQSTDSMHVKVQNYERPLNSKSASIFSRIEMKG